MLCAQIFKESLGFGTVLGKGIGPLGLGGLQLALEVVQDHTETCALKYGIEQRPAGDRGHNTVEKCHCFSSIGISMDFLIQRDSVCLKICHMTPPEMNFRRKWKEGPARGPPSAGVEQKSLWQEMAQ